MLFPSTLSKMSEIPGQRKSQKENPANLIRSLGEHRHLAAPSHVVSHPIPRSISNCGMDAVPSSAPGAHQTLATGLLGSS